MAVPGVVERFRTGSHTYTVQRQRNGQLVYRKDGRFTSKRSVTSARHYSVQNEPVGTIQIESRDDLASRPLAGVADKKDGEWIAGPDASQYDPSVSPGEEISQDRAFILRNLRSQERRFYEFAIQQPPDMTIPEMRERFAEWKEALANATTPDERREIMREFGWDETE